MSRSGLNFALLSAGGVAAVAAVNIMLPDVAVTMPEKVYNGLKDATSVEEYIKQNNIDPKDKEKTLFTVSLTSDRGKTLVAGNVPVTVESLRDFERYAKGAMPAERLATLVVKAREEAEAKAAKAAATPATSVISSDTTGVKASESIQK